MKHLKVSLFLLLAVFALSAGAQEAKNVIWTFNYGYKGVNPTLNEAWPIRQDVGNYHENGFNSGVNLSSEFNYFGVSPEYSFPGTHLSVSAGLRYINLSSDIVKNDYDRGGYFFLRLKSEGPVTNYARVKAIREEINYLGVPLEVKYTPFTFPYIALYVKLSGELAYKLSSTTDIEFKMKEMEVHEDAALWDLDVRVNPLFASVYASVGARFKLNKKLYISLDVFLPSIYMTKENSALVNLNNSSGMQFSLDLPL